MGNMRYFDGPEWNGDYTCHGCDTYHIGDPFTTIKDAYRGDLDFCSSECSSEFEDACEAALEARYER
jgi:hypothetical protein